MRNIIQAHSIPCAHPQMALRVAPLNSPTDGFNNGFSYDWRQQNHPLLQAARTEPSKIDTLLQPYLHNHAFPKAIEQHMRDYVNICVTPGLYGDQAPDRPNWYYANCLVHGMLLGRAYSLLSTPMRPPKSLSNPIDFPFIKLPAELRLLIYEYYKEDQAQRQRYWDVMTRVFLKALWSGRDPEEGSRYITGVILLAGGHALSTAAPLLRGYGKRWIWWDDRIAVPEHSWGWQELRQAIMATSSLPRSNTNIRRLRNSWERVRSDWDTQADIAGNRLEDRERMRQEQDIWCKSSEYVSTDVLQILDLAREHLRTDERDWTPPELAAKFLGPMFEKNEEGHRIWQATGLVPRALEKLPEEVSDGEPW
ncbi:hypothetical protein BDV96DRAFT_571384 [Lophiotrema nucula]|uniref:Uncharacterized protein n=1 Tax=Lophiotrema nucula TaxID=690887 RepID=A0A6A5ZCR8_9PLEO|nr:hypothetical protein BDV96DRAFT_571384 [Lophiotrema nucula]